MRCGRVAWPWWRDNLHGLPDPKPAARVRWNPNIRGRPAPAAQTGDPEGQEPLMPDVKIEQLTHDEVNARWQAWIGRIYDETISLGWNRRMFRMMRDIVKANARLQQTGGHVIDWMFGNYVVAAAMTFRRELDKQAGTENLRNLLHEIEARPDVLSRARHRALWGPKTMEFYGPDQAFDELPIVKHADDPERDHLDPASVRADRLRLQDATERVRVFVERTYAHRTPKGEPTEQSKITFQDFDVAVDAVAAVFTSYHTIITLRSLMDIEPTPQYDTHECFNFPWSATESSGQSE